MKTLSQSKLVEVMANAGAAAQGVLDEHRRQGGIVLRSTARDIRHRVPSMADKDIACERVDPFDMFGDVLGLAS